jgi:acyl-CoA synthetase (NDP forming)
MWTYTLPSERSVEILNEAEYPLFTGALGCARTLRAMADYRARREHFLAASPITPTPPQRETAALLAQAGTVLCEWEAGRVLASCGISNNGGTLARSADEALAAARTIGRAVALKVQSPDIPHKTEAGALALDVSLEEVSASYARVLANAERHAPAAHIQGVLVQPMAARGREVIVGVKRDPRWGPLVMVGLGGVLVEALGDVALAPAPLDRDAALALIGRLKGAAVLGAHRGRPASDLEAFADVVAKLSHFACAHADEIAEIDLNPVIVHAQGEGVTLADALIVKREEAAPGQRAAE